MSFIKIDDCIMNTDYVTLVRRQPSGDVYVELAPHCGAMSFTKAAADEVWRIFTMMSDLKDRKRGGHE